MRVPKSLITAVLFVLVAACGGGADASSAASGKPATTDELRPLVQQYGLGGGDKDVAVEALCDLGPRAAPGLLEIARDPATEAHEQESIMFIAALCVREPQIFQALRTRAEAIPDPEERNMRVRLIDAMSTAPGMPYPG